jgi:hypothetical protein
MASLQDHPHGSETPFALFGIRAHLPKGARLIRFRFEAGRYRLNWRRRDLHIGLHRWAPAGVVLERQSLTAFTAGQFQMPPVLLTATRQSGFTAADARVAPSRRLPAICRFFLPQRLVRTWHVPAQNTLLGVEVRGRGGGDRLITLFNRLADAYETC